jgi:hypothetical protein
MTLDIEMPLRTCTEVNVTEVVPGHFLWGPVSNIAEVYVFHLKCIVEYLNS